MPSLSLIEFHEKLELAILLKNSQEAITIVENSPEFINEPDDFGSRPLHIAAKSGDITMINAFLKAGANVDATNGDGETALLLAAGKNSPKVLAALLEAGAKVDATNSQGETALHFAAKRDNPEILTALIKAGAKIDEKDVSGKTPLSIATSKYNELRSPDLPQTVPLLLAAGASLDDAILNLTRGGMNEAAIERADKLGAMLIARTASTEGTVYEGRITNIDDLITRMKETDAEAPHRHEMVETFKALELRKQREKPGLVQIEAAKAAREADKAGREAHELSAMLTKEPTSDRAKAASIVVEQARLPFDKAKESLRRANIAAEAVGLQSIFIPGILTSNNITAKVSTQPELDQRAAQAADQREVRANAAELRRLLENPSIAHTDKGGASDPVQRRSGSGIETVVKEIGGR